MPLLKIQILSPSCRLAIWNITESPEELVELQPLLSETYDEVCRRFKSLRRRQEFLAVRAMLIELSGGILPVVRYDENGKPSLDDGRPVSFSHTQGYATVLMSTDEEVGIDIEQRTARVTKVAHMFLRDDETAESLEEMLVIWSAKETVYKLFSSQALTFQEMRVRPFSPQQQGVIVVENLKAGVVVNVEYRFTNDYVLTFCHLHPGISNTMI